MQPDENCIRPERDGVRDSILAGGQINRAVLSDGFSECVGVIGCAVTLSPKGTDVDPRVDRRQIQHVGLNWFWQRAQRGGFINILNRGYSANVFIVESMRKSLHFIHFPETCDAPCALAICRKNRYPSTDDAFHIDLGASAVLIADNYSGASHV